MEVGLNLTKLYVCLAVQAKYVTSTLKEEYSGYVNFYD